MKMKKSKREKDVNRKKTTKRKKMKIIKEQDVKVDRKQ